MGQRYSMFLVALCSTLAVGSNACQEPRNSSGKTTIITVWGHSGRAEEQETLQGQILQFNRENRDLQVELNVIPEGSYNGQVQAAALAGDLPDVLELDGPFVASYAWRHYIRAIDDVIAAELLQDLLPSIIAQGTYRDRLYAVGVFDSGLGLYGRRSALIAAGARIPESPLEAWTIAEFENLLQLLAARDPDGAVLDLKLNYQGEWYSYAFSPAVQSAGGDLVTRNEGSRAQGAINGEPAVRAMTHFQRWISAGLVDPNLDDRAFISGRVALSWVGHWEYQNYRQHLADELVLLPLPDFGKGSRTGQGSWVWSITNSCAEPELASRFLRFLLQPDQVNAMTNANGAVPATRSALRRSELYGQSGPLRLFSKQLIEGWSVPRPKTPAYPVISSVFERAFQHIRDGANVRRTLDQTAALIDREFRDNHDYPEK